MKEPPEFTTFIKFTRKQIMPVVTIGFKNWLKGSTNMKLSTDVAVVRITHEGITTYLSLCDFDAKSLQNLPSVCKESIPAVTADPANGITAEIAVNGANIPSISVRRLITAMHAAKYYKSIDRTMDAASMHYTNVLSNFMIEYESYLELKKGDDPKIPRINDKDSDRRIIRWAPIFMDTMCNTYGIEGPLGYVLRDDAAVPAEADDPLDANAYHGASGSLLQELIARLPHSGPIYKNNNATVYSKIEEAVRGTSVESTIKSFARTKNGRAAYLALIANHAGDTKYRSIMKKRMNLLQNIKWNGRSYPLESHVSNHRQAVDDLKECSRHITVSAPDPSQRVEYLIDSIACSDNTLQAVIGLVRANTNNMRSDFELASSTLIEVDSYTKSMKNPAGRNANLSAIDFSSGRGSTGVDLRWHPKSEFMKLSKDQRNELSTWLKTDDGQKYKKASFTKGNNNGKRKQEGNAAGGNWKKKFKKALKSDKGLKTIMSMMAKEEQSNQSLVSALSSTNLPPTPTTTIPNPPSTQIPQNPSVSSTTTAQNVSVRSTFPATNVKLQSILKQKK